MTRVEVVNPLLPVGTGILWYTGTAPPGWLLCQGQSLLRTDFPALFAVIGTTYGAVDGTHFTLPDLRQRFPLGASPGALGTTGGAFGHTHTSAAHVHTHLTTHSHGGTTRSVSGTSAIHGGSSVSGQTLNIGTWTSTAGGSGTSHATSASAPGSTDSATPGATGANDPPYQIVNFAIKAF